MYLSCECGYSVGITFTAKFVEADQPWVDIIPARKMTLLERLRLKPRPKPKRHLRRHITIYMVPAYDLDNKEITAVHTTDLEGNPRYRQISPEVWNVLVAQDANLWLQTKMKEDDERPLACPKCGTNKIKPARNPFRLHRTPRGNPDFVNPVFLD